MLQWNLAYAPHSVCKNKIITTIAALCEQGFDTLPAAVPGNFELDLMRAGKLCDLYFSTDTLEAQKLENLHVWYFTEFDMAGAEGVLRFEGIDTVADIYLNGSLAAQSDNMFLPLEIDRGFRAGKNELLVHIKPACIEARAYTLPVSSGALKYNYASLSLRKAAHMFGWDIMPRIVSAGLWKEVKLLPPRKPNRLEEVCFVTNRVDPDNRRAQMRLYVHAVLDGDFTGEYSVKVKGVCGDSVFTLDERLWHNSYAVLFDIEDCMFWNPRPAGEPNLYDVTVELYCGEMLCDTVHTTVGVRTVKLLMTECAGDGGEFCFEVNGKKVFLLGTNWVPLDAFPSQAPKRLEQALDMLTDIGCNAVRCWGGNAYESDAFYDYCDRKGILVWQDFAMGCAVYPQERLFAEQLEREVIAVVKRLRHHPCIALWAGDNECDCAYESWYGFRRDPNRNFLTRETVSRAVEAHDYARPYLPSSPYIGPAAHQAGAPTSEDHLWGPRDYFKGDFYRNSVCHFASETGYHGFPSVTSLKRFLAKPEKIFNDDGTPTDEYLVHAAGMELKPDSPYAYRIRLAYTQVETLFGKAAENLDDFVKQSQISQAEAKKYFIERFRIGKWRRTGILWWNLVDGWPQVSDAVVDYYFTKKLAYHYIKRSQAPVCLMFDEPDENGVLRLFGVNDLPESKRLSYTVTDVVAGKNVLSGEALLPPDASVPLVCLPVPDAQLHVYLIEWHGNAAGRNHYTANLKGMDYSTYLSALQTCGFDEFEGIGEENNKE